MRSLDLRESTRRRPAKFAQFSESAPGRPIQFSATPPHGARISPNRRWFCLDRNGLSPRAVFLGLERPYKPAEDALLVALAACLVPNLGGHHRNDTNDLGLCCKPMRIEAIGSGPTSPLARYMADGCPRRGSGTRPTTLFRRGPRAIRTSFPTSTLAALQSPRTGAKGPNPSPLLTTPLRSSA
jgi:hypothetical protein